MSLKKIEGKAMKNIKAVKGGNTVDPFTTDCRDEVRSGINPRIN